MMTCQLIIMNQTVDLAVRRSVSSLPGCPPNAFVPEVRVTASGVYYAVLLPDNFPDQSYQNGETDVPKLKSVERDRRWI